MTNKNDWKAVLKEKIKVRYSQLNSDNSKKINISALSQLGLEIDKMSPPFAIDFVDECYSVLSSFRYEASQKKKDLIKIKFRLA